MAEGGFQPRKAHSGTLHLSRHSFLAFDPASLALKCHLHTFLCSPSPLLRILAPLTSLPLSVQSQPVVLSPIVVFVPGGVLDIQDAPANSSQHVQIFIKNILNLKQVPCYLGPLDAKEARKGTLLAIFPAGKMVLTVTYLKRSQHQNSCSPF